MKTVITAALAVFFMLFGGCFMANLGVGLVAFGVTGLILLAKGEIRV